MGEERRYGRGEVGEEDPDMWADIGFHRIYFFPTRKCHISSATCDEDRSTCHACQLKTLQILSQDYIQTGFEI